MNTALIREQLREQIDNLPDDIVRQVADFALFIMERYHIEPLFNEWSDQEWRDFSLAQFFRDEDEVTCSLKDAQEVYRP